MENSNQENTGTAPKTANPVNDFNLGLFIYVINKTVVWLVLIVIVSVTLSIVYLRYAPRIYESKTTLMLKSQKTTQILGVQDLVEEQSDMEIVREMQLLKSRFLLEE